MSLRVAPLSGVGRGCRQAYAPRASWRRLLQVEQFGPWTVHAASLPGAAERWCVLPDVRVGARRLLVAAVFDGGAGGREATAAGAAALGAALEDGMDDVLAAVNPAVQATRGTSTAVIAAIDPAGADGGLACVGGSSAYTLHGERLHRLTPPEGTPGRLGNAVLSGATLPLSLGRQPLLLCTQGIDRSVAPDVLEDLLRAPAGVRGAEFELLFDEVRSRDVVGATAVLVTRD